LSCGNLSACLLCRWVGHFLARNVNQHLLSAGSLAIRFAAVAGLAKMRSAEGCSRVRDDGDQWPDSAGREVVHLVAQQLSTYQATSWVLPIAMKSSDCRLTAAMSSQEAGDLIHRISGSRW
jgi:hypothetical protein